MEARTSIEYSYRFFQEESTYSRCIDCGRFKEEHPVIIFTQVVEDVNAVNMGRLDHEVTFYDGKFCHLGYEISSIIRCEEFNKEIQLELF